MNAAPRLNWFVWKPAWLWAGAFATAALTQPALVFKTPKPDWFCPYQLWLKDHHGVEPSSALNPPCAGPVNPAWQRNNVICVNVPEFRFASTKTSLADPLDRMPSTP